MNSYLLRWSLLLWIGIGCWGCGDATDEVSVIIGGDALFDRGVRHQIKLHGAEFLFDGIDSLFQTSDFALINLECPVTDTASPIRKKFIFRADPNILPFAKQAGITHCILANNHTHDQGRRGLLSTIRHVSEQGLVPIGAGINQQEACAPGLLQKKDTRIAIFSSVQLILENWMYLEDEPAPCQATSEQLVEAIQLWKQQHPSDLILVSLHWGREFYHRPNIDQVMSAHQLVDAGADAVIGHHPHVVQAIEVYKGKPILYSIGNLIFDQQGHRRDECLAVRLLLSDNKLRSVQLFPLYIYHSQPSPMQAEVAADFIAFVQGISPNAHLAPTVDSSMYHLILSKDSKTDK